MRPLQFLQKDSHSTLFLYCSESFGSNAILIFENLAKLQSNLRACVLQVEQAETRSCGPVLGRVARPSRISASLAFPHDVRVARIRHTRQGQGVAAAFLAAAWSGHADPLPHPPALASGLQGLGLWQGRLSFVGENARGGAEPPYGTSSD
jgi:hypothetical protein